MSKVLDFSDDNGFCPGRFLFQNSKKSSSFLSLGSHIDVYFPPRKRSRIIAPFLVSECPPSIDILPDECLFEILRRLPGGQDRSVCASVSKRWLFVLSSISADEICSSAAQDVEHEIVSDCNKADESAKPKEKVESGDVTNGVKKSDDEECVDTDHPQGYLSRSLDGKKATDVRLAAISVGTASRGGLGKLSICGNSSTCRLTNFGLKAISRGCPSLRELSLWNLSSIDDEGLSAIATGSTSLEKLDLSHCPAITDKAITAIAMNCPNLRSVALESCSSIGNESLKALGSYCSQLKFITVKNCPRVGDQGITCLFSSAGHVLTRVNLQTVHISDVSLAVIGHYGIAVTDLALGGLCGVKEKGFWVMGKARGLQKLRSLSISSCQGVTDTSLEAVGKGCPELKMFSLHKCALVSDNGVVSFAKNASLLEVLKLEETHRITQCGVFGILAGGRLKALSLSNCLGLQDMEFGFRFTYPCSSLRSLSIRNCPGFGDSGLSMMGRLCTKLSHLDLTGQNGITDSGVLPLVRRRAEGGGLVKVKLSGCVNLTDNVVAEASKVHGQSLEILSVEGCRSISDASLMSIASNCWVLRELDVSGCRITDSGVAAVAMAEQLRLQVFSVAGCRLVCGKSLGLMKKLVGLNIQQCHGMSSGAKNMLVEQLWRCDVLC